MATNYLHIPAVGQLDEYACWAACLKWWYKAVKNLKKSQKNLIAKYNYLTDDYGAMSDDAVQYVIVDNDMYPHMLDSATRFTSAELAGILRWGPVFVAYTESSTQKKHCNVIYELLDGNSGAPRVRVMEPQHIQKADLTYKGQHQLKPLADFNRFGSVYCGHP